MKLKFLGASGTVTGSKYLLTDSQTKSEILIDCGLFQGERQWREKNWLPPVTKDLQLEAILLTHAHIDHTGILPRWMAQSDGKPCPVYCTDPTLAISRILLPDSGRLQEEEAEYRRDYGKSHYNPPLPLYTEADAKYALDYFRSVKFNTEFKVPATKFIAKWIESGHILGAGSIELRSSDGKLITFSGDIGQFDDPIAPAPKPVEFGDLLLIESTYGDRLHSPIDPAIKFADVINKTYDKGGTLLIPSFAVGRTQQLLYYLSQLKQENKVPDMPIIIDSPMAADATYIYREFSNFLGNRAKEEFNKGLSPFSPSKLHFTRDRSESIKLNSIHEPMIIISASGLLTGGRILHHLKHKLSDHRNTVLFVGFQPPGGKGDKLLRGDQFISVLNDKIEVRADIEQISGLSAHADKKDLIKWCKQGKGTPKEVLVVHGEPESSESFAKTLRDELKWNARVAKFGEEIEV